MKTTIFRGSGTALITPMDENGDIYYEKLEELLEEQIAEGTDAVIVAGTTGESACLTADEHSRLIRFCSKTVHGRIPVIAGAGSNCTAHAQELCESAEKAGADALLLVTPYYNKCSQEGLVRHYAACAGRTTLPLILYNVPSRTGVNIQPSTYEKLVEIPNIAAVKEASGDFTQISRIAAQYEDRLDIYCGNDDQIIPMLSIGAKGVISVLSNICPADVHRICASYQAGNQKESKRLQLIYEKLIAALFSDVNPIPVKTAMNLMGKQVGPCRLPLCEMEDGAREALHRCLAEYHLLP